MKLAGQTRSDYGYLVPLSLHGYGWLDEGAISEPVYLGLYPGKRQECWRYELDGEGQPELLPRLREVADDGNPGAYCHRNKLVCDRTRNGTGDDMPGSLCPGLIGDVAAPAFGTVDQEDHCSRRGKESVNG